VHRKTVGLIPPDHWVDHRVAHRHCNRKGTPTTKRGALTLD
jgi:hypothetical protein